MPRNQGQRRSIPLFEDDAWFWVKADIFDESSCWPWVRGARNHRGYGQVSLSGVLGIRYTRPFAAHRIAFQQFYGVIVPVKLDVDHRCENTACINPLHLQMADPVENRGRYGRSKTHCVNGHPLEGENLLLVHRSDRPRPTRRCRVCANDADARRSEKRKREVSR